MNKFFLPIFALSTIVSTPVLAVEAHHPDQQNPASRTAPAVSGDVGKAVNEMKENTKKMQTQLDKIRQTKDPQESQKLLQEHMRTLQENMMLGKSMMGDMMDCPMMKDGMMGGGMGMMGSKGGMAGQDDMMTKRMEMMEKRMDMMQMLIQKNLGMPQGAPETPAK